MTQIDLLLHKCKDLSIQRDVSLAPLVSFRIGGNADAYLRPTDESQLLTALQVCRELDIPVFILGNGSNVLVRDGGFPGLILHLTDGFAQVTRQGTCITAGAGCSLTALAQTAVNNGLMGLEWACGIPGTVGGACAMNAGAYGGEMKQVLKKVRIIRNGAVETVPVCEDDLGYRFSRFAAPDCIVLRAELALQPDDGHALERQRDFMQRRKEKQPLQYPSAGSVFKRPAGFFAGKLIEDAGLKGFRVGDAMVSELHAGFIINCGHATAQDVLQLIAVIQERVEKQFQVKLECEIKIIGVDGN